MAATLPMYQGEDWTQTLSFFTDASLATPYEFTNPVMDVRSQAGARIATFDDLGKEGLAVITAPGVLKLTMSWDNTAQLPPATYQLDIFGDVGEERKAILKRGTIQLTVTARITHDDNPVGL